MGVLFGIVLTKGELASWFRIQEALRFKGPYLYEVFASALAVAAPGFALLKRRARALTGEPIVVPPKVLGSGVRYVAGSVLFGLGWALIGACPGPMFALLGAGVGVMSVVWVAALARGDAVVVGRLLVPVRGDQFPPPDRVLRVPAAASPGPLGRHHRIARHRRARRPAARARARPVGRGARPAGPARPDCAGTAARGVVDRLGHAGSGPRGPPLSLSPHVGRGVARRRAALVSERSRALPARRRGPG